MEERISISKKLLQEIYSVLYEAEDHLTYFQADRLEAFADEVERGEFECTIGDRCTKVQRELRPLVEPFTPWVRTLIIDDDFANE